MKAFKGSLSDPIGEGILSIMASNTVSTPKPVLADILIISAGSMPKIDSICAAIRSGSAAGRSI